MRRRLAQLVVMAGLWGQVAVAQDLCDQLGAVLDRVQDKRPDAGAALALPGPAICVDTVDETAAHMSHCYWSYSYRDPAAVATFDRIARALAGCAAQSAGGDQLVNHPDSYDRLAMTWAGRRVSVSRKDKGALQQTLVFLAVGS